MIRLWVRLRHLQRHASGCCRLQRSEVKQQNENQKRKYGREGNKFTWTKQKAAINKSANLAIFSHWLLIGKRSEWVEAWNWNDYLKLMRTEHFAKDNDKPWNKQTLRLRWASLYLFVIIKLICTTSEKKSTFEGSIESRNNWLKFICDGNQLNEI